MHHGTVESANVRCISIAGPMNKHVLITSSSKRLVIRISANNRWILQHVDKNLLKHSKLLELGVLLKFKGRMKYAHIRHVELLSSTITPVNNSNNNNNNNNNNERLVSKMPKAPHRHFTINGNN